MRASQTCHEKAGHRDAKQYRTSALLRAPSPQVTAWPRGQGRSWAKQWWAGAYFTWVPVKWLARLPSHTDCITWKWNWGLLHLRLVTSFRGSGVTRGREREGPPWTSRAAFWQNNSKGSNHCEKMFSAKWWKKQTWSSFLWLLNG